MSRPSQRSELAAADAHAIAFEGTHLHVHTPGDFGGGDRLDFWRKVVQACEEHQCFNILGDSSGNRSVAPMEAYDIYEVFKEAGVSRKHRIAWVVRNPANFEPMLFTETVLKNRTLTRTRVFTGVTSATQWLLNTPG